MTSTTSPERLKRLITSTLLGAAAFVGYTGAAAAFGTEGHEVVALVAQQLLKPDVRRRVDAILAAEPGATFVSVANWADLTRNRSTAAWHYVNLPRDAGCAFIATRDCPNGNCAVAALQAQAERLADSTASAQQRFEALKYVMHFVADMHQPLHAGFADDRGGNSYQVQAFGHGTNLHALWDTALLQAIEPDASALSRTILGLEPPGASLTFAPAAWAGESCRIASRPDFYPARIVGADYLQTFRPVLLGRLQLAGYRLASVLNAKLAQAP